MVRTYVRIFGPPILKAIKALEGVAVEMNKSEPVKFSHKCIPYPRFTQQDSREWRSYIQTLEKTYVDCYEPSKLISDAKEMLGDSDFFFEWRDKPTMNQIELLIGKIDEALKGIGCFYALRSA